MVTAVNASSTGGYRCKHTQTYPRTAGRRAGAGHPTAGRRAGGRKKSGGRGGYGRAPPAQEEPTRPPARPHARLPAGGCPAHARLPAGRGYVYLLRHKGRFIAFLLAWTIGMSWCNAFYNALNINAVHALDNPYVAWFLQQLHEISPNHPHQLLVALGVAALQFLP